MSWQRILATGRGEVRFRLMIEGAAFEPVSHRSMARTTADGRVRFLGLREVVKWTERTDPGRATTNWGGFDAVVLDTERNHYATKLFSWRPSGRRFLAANLTATATTMFVDSTAGIAENQVLHVGTEAVRVDGIDSATELTIEREYWDTIGQAHYASDGRELSAQAVLLDRPRTLEGRRAYVYAYGEGDDPLGDGTLIFRGICQTDGKSTGDGSTWQIKIAHIGVLLKQDLGADLEEPTTPRGIYYPASAPLKVEFNDIAAGVRVAKYFSGFFADNQALCDAINAWFAAEVLASASDIARIEAVVTVDGKWVIHFETGATNTVFGITAASPVDGPLYRISVRDTGEIVTISSARATLATATAYTLDANDGAATIEGERTVPRGVFTEGVAGPGDALWFDPTVFTDGLPDAAAAPPTRIYLAGIITPRIGAVHIEWPATGDETDHIGLDANTTDRYVDLDRSSAPAAYGLTYRPYTSASLPQLTFRRHYHTGSVRGFALALISLSPDLANLGASPFLVDGDIGAWAAAIDDALPPSVAQRIYVSQGAVKLEDYFGEEFKMRGLFWRSDADGKLDVAKLLSVAITQVPDHEITDFALGVEGLPTWERTALGSLNTVEFSTVYNPATDEHNEPLRVRNVAAYAERKAPRTLEVKPYSIDRRGLASYLHLGSLMPRELVGLFSTVLGIFGGDYAVATMMVTLRHFDILCGQIVRFTSNSLPNIETGERGGTFTGQVIGRSPDIRAGVIQLQVLVGLGISRGYPPSCGVDVASSSGGPTSWTLRLLYTDPDANSLWWHTSDVLSNHVRVGDRVRIQRWNSTSAGAVNGTVDDVRDAPNPEIDVLFDGAVTLGSDKWVIDFAPASTIQADTSVQDDYAFEAGTDGFIGYADGDERATEYSP